jgi:hypothetical protein
MGALSNQRSRVHYVLGRQLAYELRELPANKRADCAAACRSSDSIVIIEPTAKQLAALYHVSLPTLAKARNGGHAPVSDKRIERLIAAVGPERVLRIFDRLTAPALDAAKSTAITATLAAD